MGRYASEPLTIKNTYIRVWCLEELCYYICENADLLEDNFASNELIDWVADECGLKELAIKLVHEQGSERFEVFHKRVRGHLTYLKKKGK